MNKNVEIEGTLPELSAELGEATVKTDGDLLVVGTGKIERRWKWTGKGLVTVGLRDLSSGREWADVESQCGCDWSIPGSIEEHAASIISLIAEPSTDEGFTSEHLAVKAEIGYPAVGVSVKYIIWSIMKCGSTIK